MAAMEQLYKPVPAIDSIAIAKVRPIRKKRPLQDICTQLDYDKIARKMHNKITAMATCSPPPSSGYGDSNPPGDLYSVQNATGTLAVPEECRIRANNYAACDTGSRASPELEKNKGHRWEMASKLAFMYETGVLEWQNKIDCDVSERLGGFIGRSGNDDANLNLQILKSDEDDDLFFEAKYEKDNYYHDPEEEIWHSMMVAMFSSMNEEPCSGFPGICNPTQVKIVKK